MGTLPPENMNFLNFGNAGFWHSGRLFATDTVSAKLEGFFFGDLPSFHPIFFSDPIICLFEYLYESLNYLEMRTLVFPLLGIIL